MLVQYPGSSPCSHMIDVELQLSGGGLVPLSHAICCRLCMPDELPPTQAPISKDDRAVAIMSLGCHASSGSGPFSLQCEPRGNSIVTGGLQNGHSLQAHGSEACAQEE